MQLILHVDNGVHFGAFIQQLLEFGQQLVRCDHGGDFGFADTYMKTTTTKSINCATKSQHNEAATHNAPRHHRPVWRIQLQWTLLA